ALDDELTLELDGQRIDARWGEAYFEPIGAIDGTPATVEMVAHIPMSGGRHTVRLRDEMPTAAFERTDFVVTTRDGAMLLQSGRGESPSGAQRSIVAGRGE